MCVCEVHVMGTVMVGQKGRYKKVIGQGQGRMVQHGRTMQEVEGQVGVEGKLKLN